jgi:hypothetical protein
MITLRVDLQFYWVKADEEKEAGTVVLGVPEQHLYVGPVGLKFNFVSLAFGAHHVVEEGH